MTMRSANDILDVITSHKRLWPLLLIPIQLLLTPVTNTDVNIILNLNEHRSLNMNKKVTLDN